MTKKLACYFLFFLVGRFNFCGSHLRQSEGQSEGHNNLTSAEPLTHSSFVGITGMIQHFCKTLKFKIVCEAAKLADKIKYSNIKMFFHNNKM